MIYGTQSQESVYEGLWDNSSYWIRLHEGPTLQGIKTEEVYLYHVHMVIYSEAKRVCVRACRITLVNKFIVTNNAEKHTVRRTPYAKCKSMVKLNLGLGYEWWAY